MTEKQKSSKKSKIKKIFSLFKKIFSRRTPNQSPSAIGFFSKNNNNLKAQKKSKIKNKNNFSTNTFHKHAITKERNEIIELINNMPKNAVLTNDNHDFCLETEDVKNIITDLESNYSNTYIDALLSPIKNQEHTIIHNLISIDNLRSVYQEMNLNKINIIPIHLPFNYKENPVNNHFAFLVLDFKNKKNKKLSFIDPAAQEPLEQIIKLANQFNMGIWHNEKNLQAKEIKNGFVKHCGPYTVSLIEKAVKVINEDHKHYDLDTIIEVENPKHIREKHIGNLYKILPKNQGMQNTY